MPSDTREALGDNAEKCESRSLYFDRFANPAAEKKDRMDWFQSVCNRHPVSAKRDSWSAWLRDAGLHLKLEDILFAQLQSRLMVNIAGGVMENAGLCLDRFSGLPVIPGSAVKGCARRMAIEELRQASEDKKPVGELAALLGDIARTFGWGEQDWKTRDEDDEQFERRCQKLWEEKRSDFAYACGEHWPQARNEARNRWPSAVKDFAGAVCFLPAWPVKVSADDLPAGSPPELGKLELDILTCHHPKYYEGQDQAYALPWPLGMSSSSRCARFAATRYR